MSGQRVKTTVLRVLVLACLVCAALDVRPRVGGSSQRPLVVIDVSASVGGGPPELPRRLDVDPKWILVADGTQVVVGGTEPARLPEGATRLGSGLRLALARAPGRDVVVLTDGRDTDGDAVAAARAVREAGGRVFTRPPTRPIADVGFASAQLLGSGRVVRVRADVTSSTTGRATVRLRRGDSVVDRKTIGLAPGSLQSVELVDSSAPDVGGRWRLVLDPIDGTPDDDPGDNALTLGRRSDRREILVVGGLDPAVFAEPDRFGVSWVRRLTPGRLTAIDLVVLADAPWTNVASARSALQAHVERGGRLLLLGGPRAYGPGGWGGTMLDELSPLRVEPPPGDGLLVILLFDKSGSTADGALPHLKSAARSALLGLRSGERLALLPFDDAAASAWLGGQVLGADDVATRDAALDDVEALSASGRTDIPAALDAAIDRARRVPAETRWVVLMTDGDPDHRLVPEALAPLRRKLDEARVEFAALVVDDEEAATALREGLARRDDDVVSFRRAEQFADRLRDLVRERRLAREALPPPDRLEPAGPILPELALRSLRVGAVHDLELAPDATLAARAVWSDRSAPFVAHRSAGVGSVWAFAWGPAFAPDTAGRGASTRALRTLVHRLASEADRGLAADYVGEDVVVRLPSAAGIGALPVYRGESRADLVERAPGIFRGPAPSGAGAALRVTVPGGPDQTRPLRLPVRPPREHRGAGVDTDALTAIAAAGGGHRLGPKERPPRPAREPGPSIAAVLLLLGAILLVTERSLSKGAPRADAGGAGAE